MTAPDLCNYYCSHECPIGQEYIPEVTMKELPTVTLQIVDMLNKLENSKNRLIEIIVDGEISDDEVADFIDIKDKLEKMSLAIDTMKAWVDKTVVVGDISKKILDKK